MESTEIKRIRLELGYSQTQAAARAGVSTVTWGLWERGVCRPHPLRLPLLRRMLKRAEEQLERAE